MRRLSSNGAKAGNINHALSLRKADFFCVFDADFVPSPDFLLETLPFFVNRDRRLRPDPADLRQPVNLVSRGAGYMQTVFYSFVQPGRNHFNAAFCVGTNVIFRRAAIDDIGGIYTDSKSEDVWTSLMLHERGWPVDLHRRRPWPSAMPPRPSRPTPSSSCAGPPAASRSC